MSQAIDPLIVLRPGPHFPVFPGERVVRWSHTHQSIVELSDLRSLSLLLTFERVHLILVAPHLRFELLHLPAEIGHAPLLDPTLILQPFAVQFLLMLYPFGVEMYGFSGSQNNVAHRCNLVRWCDEAYNPRDAPITAMKGGSRVHISGPHTLPGVTTIGDLAR